jgi:hypothetical protein
MAVSDNEWWQQEFNDVDFGDKRLRDRVIRTAEQLSAQPLDPINKACSSWADTKAAYRLFANDKVDASKILESHRSRTWQRARQYEYVLAVQDTSFLNYTTHEATEGLGKIGTYETGAKGLAQHTTMAISPSGVPIGILDQRIWARKKLSTRRSKILRKRPIKEKESVRWLEALELVKKTAPEDLPVITVADRECDIYEFITHAQAIDALYVVRAARDRSIYTAENCDEVDHLWNYFEERNIAGETSVQVPSRSPKEPAREAVVEVKFASVLLKRPRKQRFTEICGIEPEVLVYAVFLREAAPPEGATPLEWMLLTNVVVENLEDALERMAWYQNRWQIEVFHKVLKSGCRVEACRLGSTERLTKYLALFAIIAWRIHWITLLNRESPQAPCTTVLEEHEWKALYCKIHKTTQVPHTPPTAQQAVRWIAQLGGFLARRGDGEPGTITIWRGWQRLTDIADDWLLFNRGETCG